MTHLHHLPGYLSAAVCVQDPLPQDPQHGAAHREQSAYSLVILIITPAQL